jgi:hypothetical protein
VAAQLGELADRLRPPFRDGLEDEEGVWVRDVSSIRAAQDILSHDQSEVSSLIGLPLNHARRTAVQVGLGSE